MNGNVTAEGITRDLEAMNKAGLGGFTLFKDGDMAKGPVDYGSQKHIDLLKHAAAEAERLGLAFSMHNCPGFSSLKGENKSMKDLLTRSLQITEPLTKTI